MKCSMESGFIYDVSSLFEQFQIVTSGGDYIWFAKGNQPEMEEDIRLWFGPDPEPIPGMRYPPKDFEIATNVTKGHGRIEKRTITVSSHLIRSYWGIENKLYYRRDVTFLEDRTRMTKGQGGVVSGESRVGSCQTPIWRSEAYPMPGMS